MNKNSSHRPGSRMGFAEQVRKANPIKIAAISTGVLGVCGIGAYFFWPSQDPATSTPKTEASSTMNNNTQVTQPDSSKTNILKSTSKKEKRQKPKTEEKPNNKPKEDSQEPVVSEEEGGPAFVDIPVSSETPSFSNIEQPSVDDEKTVSNPITTSNTATTNPTTSNSATTNTATKASNTPVTDSAILSETKPRYIDSVLLTPKEAKEKGVTLTADDDRSPLEVMVEFQDGTKTHLSTITPVLSLRSYSNTFMLRGNRSMPIKSITFLGMKWSIPEEDADKSRFFFEHNSLGRVIRQTSSPEERSKTPFPHGTLRGNKLDWKFGAMKLKYDKDVRIIYVELKNFETDQRVDFTCRKLPMPSIQ